MRIFDYLSYEFCPQEWARTALVTIFMPVRWEKLSLEQKRNALVAYRVFVQDNPDLVSEIESLLRAEIIELSDQKRLDLLETLKECRITANQAKEVLLLCDI